MATSSIQTAVGGDSSSSSSDGGLGSVFALAIPGVFCQMIVRCYFVRGYFKVEEVIRKSVGKHERETLAAANAGYTTTTTTTTTTPTGNTTNGNTTNGGNGGGEEEEDAHAETNALQLQLNDLSCSLASGCGYSLLHSLFLYGTLLASESGESNSYNEGVYAGGGGSTGHGGTLYQESCGEFCSITIYALVYYFCLD